MEPVTGNLVNESGTAKRQRRTLVAIEDQARRLADAVTEHGAAVVRELAGIRDALADIAAAIEAGEPTTPPEEKPPTDPPPPTSGDWTQWDPPSGVHRVYVDPANGQDTWEGSDVHPVGTLPRALELASQHDHAAVMLRGGSGYPVMSIRRSHLWVTTWGPRPAARRAP